MDISLVRDLRADPERPFHNGAIVAEGGKVVRMMLRAVIPSLIVGTEEEIRALNLDPTTQVVVLERSELENLVGFRPHSNIFALAPVPAPRKADVDAAGRQLLLNGIVDNANVGAIVRTAVTLGVRSILVDPATSSPWMRRAVRTSMGLVFHSSISECSDPAAFVQACIDAGKHVCMVEQTDVIVVGSEGKGINASLLRLSTLHASIPMDLAESSLNVAAATAVILAHFRFTATPS